MSRINWLIQMVGLAGVKIARFRKTNVGKVADFAGARTLWRISTGSPVCGWHIIIRRPIHAVIFVWASRRGEMLPNQNFIAMQRFSCKTQQRHHDLCRCVHAFVKNPLKYSLHFVHVCLVWIFKFDLFYGFS